MQELATFVMAEIELRREIIERKRAEKLLIDQTHALDLIAQGSPTEQVLDFLCRMAERHLPGATSGFLVTSELYPRFERAVSPSLPQEFIDLFMTSPISLTHGPCGAAAFLGQPVIVSDSRPGSLRVETAIGLKAWSPAPYVHKLLEKHGINACWAIPIFSAKGQVLGTFAVFPPAPMTPQTAEWDLIARITYIAGIAIQQERARQALITSEAQSRRLALVAKHTSNGVLIANALGYTEWINEGYTRLTGYTLEEMQGRRPSDLLSGPHQDLETLDYIQQAIANQLPFHRELINYRKDGTPIWVETSAEPLIEANGDFSGYISIEADISERKRAEDALRTSEANLQTIFDNSPQSFLLLSRDGTVIKTNKVANQHAEAALGYPIREGDSMAVFAEIEDIAVIEERMARIIRGETFSYEFSRDLGHRRVWYQVTHSPVFDEHSQVKNFIISALEVTDLKEMEIGLRSSQAHAQRLALVVSRTSNGISMTGPDGRIEWVNDSFTSLTGYRLDEIQGRYHDDFLAGPQTDPAALAYLACQNATQQPFAVELLNYRKNGEPFWMSVQGEPFYNEEGTLLGFAGLHMDVTERKEAARGNWKNRTSALPPYTESAAPSPDLAQCKRVPRRL